ncbi:hypothetical protein AC628_31985 [Bradyrhizobium sp. NAS96.2]|nr:hypothetical protein AC628_31985 [Bradyrhizobium sp. NAS96.2]
MPKKIQFNLLLADLALKFRNALWRAKVGSRDFAPTRLHSRCNRIALARAPYRPQRRRPASAKQIAPCVKILAQHLQLF